MRWSPLRFRAIRIAPSRFAALGLGALLLGVATVLSDDFVQFSRGFNPLALLEVACFVAAFGLLLGATLDLPAERVPWRRWSGSRWVPVVRGVVTVAMLLLAVISFLLCMGFLHTILFTPIAATYWNDVISFNAANAQAALSGRNPYTDDANFLPTLMRYLQAPATPIQGPIFGYGYNYPLPARVFAVDRAYMHDPVANAAAFNSETLHSYPALSFLLYIPLVALGQNVLWLHLLAYAGLFGWLVALAPREQRGWAALVAAATATIPFRTLVLDTEIICLVFLLVAWRYRERGWVSAIALGLGCAFKQYCWLFAPFFLLDTLLRQGWREAIKRAGILVGTFLALNGPYIVVDARAWLASVFLPVNGNLFPQGMGLVALSLGRFLPGWPPVVYAVAELCAFLGALWLFVRYRNVLSESVLVLALAPLVFAYRSPANYFAVLPWLALFAVLSLNRTRSAGVDRLSLMPTA